jgi:hypothetical protein
LGSTYESKELPLSEKRSIAKPGSPVIICATSIDANDFVDDSYSKYSLNLSLANELMKKPEQTRYSFVDDVVKSLVPKTGDLFFQDYDILFDPTFKLDVVGLICQLSKNRKLVTKWPGKFDGAFLKYATPQYEDYQQYDISQYNIVCIN